MFWKSQGPTSYLMHALLLRGTRAFGVRDTPQHSVGDDVRVRRSFHAPLSGHTGKIIAVNRNDDRAPFLVQFNNGLQFRYQSDELQQVIDQVVDDS